MAGLAERSEETGKLPTEAFRWLCRNDLFFLLRYGLNRPDCDNDWVFARCREVSAAPNGYLDLWAREHYKSTIITFALTIQDILNNPETTIGIFSHTRPIAKAFLRQIKREFEANESLKAWFPDVLWADPAKESPKWSEDEGIIVRRKGNPKEATVEAWGLVDGQPTSKHYAKLVYDDVVTDKSVTTPDMMAKTTDALALSYNLGARDGERRFIGTRYHFNDTYGTILERGTAKVRKYPATADGKVDGPPVFLTREKLAEKRRDFGPYVFACFVAGTPVLRSDWSQACIETLQVGDEVVGYTFGVPGKKAELVKSKVVARQSRNMPVVRFTFASGRSVVCTRDHKFWQGRATRGYAALGLGHQELNAACSLYDPLTVFAPYPEREAGYLAGMFDGEGCVSGATAHIAQSMDINPGVCARLDSAFEACGVSRGVTTPAGRPGHRDYYVTGGRQGHMRFLHVVGAAGKAPRLAGQMFANGTRNLGKGTRDRLVSIEDCGEAEVFNIQTESGNYVAGGYMVKNCQMMQDPKADETQGFSEAWLQRYSPSGTRGMNVYMLVDAASEKKKSSDYTAAWVIGLAEDRNVYVLDMVRDRLSLTQRADMVFGLHQRWRPLKVGYERYGLMSDVEHIRDRQDRENYRFNIVELGGAMPKNDRIRRLIPWFEQGRIYLPHVLLKTNYEGVQVDLVKAFIDQEFKAFPVSAHDDMLDALARMLDDELGTAWPMETYDDEDDRDRDDTGRSTHTGY